MTGPVVFEITAADSHLQIILPVVRILKTRGVPAVVFSDCELNRKPSDIAPFEREGIEYIRLSDKPLPMADPEYQNIAIPLLRRIPGEIERLQPSLVVVLNDRNSPSVDFVRAARALGVPSLMMQESLRKDLFQRPTLRKLYYRWHRKLTTGIEAGLRHYGQGGCDHLTAWGEISRQYFIRVGVKPERITITGNPRFDQLAHPDFSAEASEIRRSLGLAPEAFVLTFLSSPVEKMYIVSSREKKESIRRLLDWTGAFAEKPEWKNLRLLFKLHRGESVELFNKWLREAGATSFASTIERPLYPLLCASRASLMFSTTAGLEAALLGVPVGMYELSKPLDDWDFVGRGVARRVASRRDFEDYLRGAREDEKMGEQGREAAHQFLAHVGQAAENVAALIEKLAGFRACG